MTIPEYSCTEGHAIQPSDWLMVEAYRCRIKDLESDLAAAEKQGDAAHEACVEYAAKERALEAELAAERAGAGSRAQLTALEARIRELESDLAHKDAYYAQFILTPKPTASETEVKP